jgi:hypothetical protein
MTTLVRPKCNLRSLLSFTARAFAAMPAAAIAYPDHCEWRVAKKFPLAPDSRREPHRVPLTTPSPCYMPRRDAMSATPGQPSVSEPQRRTGRAVLLVGWRLSAICSSVRRPYALRARGMPPASKMSSRDVPWRSPLVIARRTSRHWQGLEDTERSPSREASS